MLLGSGVVLGCLFMGVEWIGGVDNLMAGKEGERGLELCWLEKMEALAAFS